VNGTSTPPTDSQSCFNLSPALSSLQFQGGEEFSYSVTYRNDCGAELTDGTLQITLPLAVEFAATNFPFLSRDGNVITYSIGDIAPNLQATVTVSGMVKEQVNNGDMLVFQSDFNYTSSRGAPQTANAFLSASVFAAEIDAAGTSTLGASVVDTLSGLFYSGWFWLILFLILIALFVFWLATRRRMEDEDEEESVGAA
jgi:hypothetical protein